jgi:hypothetical protein
MLSLIQLHDYPTSHTETNRQAGIAYLNGYRSPHHHGTDFGYLFTRPDPQGA